jgi:hypothetical protein
MRYGRVSTLLPSAQTPNLTYIKGGVKGAGFQPGDIVQAWNWVENKGGERP